MSAGIENLLTWAERLRKLQHDRVTSVRVGRELYEELREMAEESARRRRWWDGTIEHPLGIRVIVDDELGPREWKAVRASDTEIV